MSKTQARYTLAAIMLITLISMAGIALPYPILAPLFMLEETTALNSFMGVPPKLLLGIVLALYPLGQLLGGSFLGAISDLYGRKKVLSVSLGFAAMGYALSAYAITDENYLLFAFSRLATGVCGGNVAIARALALDLYPHIDRTRSMSLLMAANYTGWLLGPLAGGYLMAYGADLAFWLAGLFTLICIVLVLLFIQQAPVDQTEPATPLLRAIRKHNSIGLFREKTLLPLALFQLIFTFGLNGFYEFYPLWMVEFHQANSRDIALYTVVTTAVMITCSALIVTPLSRITSPLPLMFCSLFVLTMCFAALPFTPYDSMIVIFMISGAMIPMVNGVLPAYLSTKFAHLGQGRIMGLMSFSFGLSNVTMALVGSAVSLVGSQWALYLASFSIAIAAVWLLSYHQRLKK